ncbi:MAG: Smr/MutS family protein [Spirosomataceae bacterium]
MNIGDRVRLLHSKEEGIVTKFLKGDVVEVEIEEGFKLPVLKRELAVVAKTENRYFGENKTEEKPKVNVKAEVGVFVAFQTNDNKNYSIFILNNTDWDFAYTLTSDYDNKHRGLMGGFIQAKSFHKSQIELSQNSFDEWGVFTFQAIYYTLGFFKEKPQLTKKLRLRAESFFNNKKIAPFIEKEAHLYQLDGEEKPFSVNPVELKEKILENTKVNPVTPKQFTKPSSVIDLHIEQLTNHFSGMPNNEIVALQLKSFEQNLESAIATGMDEITFIHGVGNGVLRNEIQKKLANHKNVAWFADAQKEKFGYGATKVKIK